MARFYRNPSGKDVGQYSLRRDENPEVLIFAEGASESYFLEKWLVSIDKDPKKIAVVCYEGNTSKLGALLKKLTDEENFPTVKSLGFFLDAEGDQAASKVHSIQALLRKAELISETHNLVAGSQTVGSYRLAIYVSPNNADAGMIEDMIVNEIAGSPLSSCVNVFSDAVAKTTGNPPHPKCIVNAYLGIHRPGTCGAGHGFNKDVLDVHHSAYDAVRTVISAIL